jgi:hypothetical protein
MFRKTLRALPGQFSRQNDQNPTSGTKCAKSVCDPDKTFYTLSRARFVGHDSGVLGSRALALPFLPRFSARSKRDVDRRSEGHRKNVVFHVSDAKKQRKPLFSLL